MFNGTGATTLFNVTIVNADGSFVYDTFDTAHGDALQQVTTVLADTSWSRWTYDTANAFAWSKEFAQYNTAGLLASDGGYNHDGSSWANWHDVAHGDAIYQADQTSASGTDHRTVWDTAGTQGWSSYVEDLTAAGQVVDQTFSNRDGTRTVNEYDAAHGYALQSQAVVQANGSTVLTVWDTAGTQGWTHYVEQVNSAGQDVGLTFSNRDGTTLVQSFDLAHGDQLQISDLHALDGTVHRMVYDTAATNPWSYYKADFDKVNHCVDQLFVNRDGTQTLDQYDPVHGYALLSHAVVQVDGSQTQTVYDTPGTDPWASYVATYAAGNVCTSETFTNRDGTTLTQSFDLAHGDKLQISDLHALDGTVHRVVYDTAGTNPWSYYRADFDKANHCVDQLFVNRDGTQTLNDFDPAHGYALLSTAVVQADGSQVQTIYDTSGTQSWSSEVNTFDVSGELLGQTFSMRDSTVSHVLTDSATHQFVAVTDAAVNTDVKMMIMNGSQMTSIDYSSSGHLNSVVYYDGSHSTNITSLTAASGMTLAAGQMNALTTTSTTGTVAQISVSAVCAGMFAAGGFTAGFFGVAFATAVCGAAGLLAQQINDRSQGGQGSSGLSGMTPDQARQYCDANPGVCTSHW